MAVSRGGHCSRRELTLSHNLTFSASLHTSAGVCTISTRKEVQGVLPPHSHCMLISRSNLDHERLQCPGDVYSYLPETGNHFSCRTSCRYCYCSRHDQTSSSQVDPPFSAIVHSIDKTAAVVDPLRGSERSRDFKMVHIDNTSDKT